MHIQNAVNFFCLQHAPTSERPAIMCGRQKLFASAANDYDAIIRLL